MACRSGEESGVASDVDHVASARGANRPIVRDTGRSADWRMRSASDDPSDWRGAAASFRQEWSDWCALVSWCGTVPSPHPESHDVRDAEQTANLGRISLPALIALWARIVADMERRAQSSGISASTDALAHTFDAELKVRHEISKRIRSRPTTAETREMLAELDQFFRDATEDSSACVLGDAEAEAYAWTRTREWYFWRVLKGPQSE